MNYRKLYTEILRLGWPILVGQIGAIATGMADTLMVGRYSTEALASASCVNNIFNVTIFCIVGFTYGVTPLVGAMWGQGRHHAIGALVRRALRLNVLFSLAVTALMTWLYFNLDVLDQPSELLPIIRPYYLTQLAAMVGCAMYNVMAQWSYGIRNTRMPTVIILSGNALNVVGNWLLIYGELGCPEMGLLGAGISTLAVRWLCVAAILWAFFGLKANRRYVLGYRMRRTRSDVSWGRLFKTSMPVSLQLTFESGSFTVAAVMVGWLGTVELAAFQIFMMTGTLGFCVYYAFGTGVSVLVANAKGLGDVLRQRRTAMAGLHVMLALMTFSSLIFIFWGRYIMEIFSEDPAVLAAAWAVIWPLVLYQAGDAIQINFSNALRGTAHVMPMLWTALVSYCVVGVPATYLLTFTCGLGLPGVVLSFSVSLFTAAALYLWAFLRATRPAANA